MFKKYILSQIQSYRLKKLSKKSNKYMSIFQKTINGLRSVNSEIVRACVTNHDKILKLREAEEELQNEMNLMNSQKKDNLKVIKKIEDFLA